MAEFIEREAVLRDWPLCDEPADAYQFIRGFPAADVVERKTGKWRRYSPLTDTFECDQCGYQVIDKEFRTNFCPNCGCAMEVPTDV